MAEYERLTAEGVWIEMTKEEAWEHQLATSIALYGEEEGRKDAEAKWKIAHIPNKPRSEMTEAERSFADRMQSEEEVNIAAREAGSESILDLLIPSEDEFPDPLAPRDDDDEEVEIDLRDAREYDYEGASADLAARKAREKARREREGS